MNLITDIFDGLAKVYNLDTGMAIISQPIQAGTSRDAAIEVAEEMAGEVQEIDAIFNAAEACSCTALEGDPMTGWHLMRNWAEAQPGDILYDGELWMACRCCNWGDGLPHDAIILSVPGGLWAMQAAGAFQ